MSWWYLGALTVAAYAFKAVGVLAFDGAPLRGRMGRMVALMPAALLAALVAIQTVTDGRELVVDARLAGLGFATVAAWRRWPFVVVVVGAAAVTALVRWVA